MKIWHPELSVILTDKIGEGTTIHAMVWIGRDVTIGKNCKIQAHAFIPDGVTIGNDVFIGPGVRFANDRYPPSEDRTKWEFTAVEDGAVIGMNASIGPGVWIGKCAFIGMGAVVLRDVPANQLWVGNPATILKTRSNV